MGCGLCGLVLFCARSSDLGAEFIFDRTKPIFDRACGINGLQAIGTGLGGGCWGWSRRGVSERRRLVLCVIHLLNASGSRGGVVQGGGVREIGSVLPTPG